MLARRFLWIIAGLIVLTIAAALGYRLFGEHLMRAAMVPSVSFEASRQAPAPDYRRAALWLARPDLPDDPSRWTPEGYEPAPKPGVAIFYLHPTTYLGRDRWNGPFDNAEANERARLFTQTQASAFNGVGAVWAPRYRQATFGAFLSDKGDAEKAIDFAYGDISAAFDAFLATVPASRPIILVGHSQGSMLLLRLLKDRIAGTPLARRILAVYAAGWPISLEADLPALGLDACDGPGQINCILSWQSFAEPADPGLIRDAFDRAPGLTGANRKGTRLLCTNPLTGAPGTAALPAANLGALQPTDDYAGVVLQSARIGARCADSGILLIGSAPQGFGRYVLPGNNYHVYDYALFWANIRADAEARTATWFGQAPR
jgi:hypothetical protein